MGKGDKKTRKGKIFKASFGNTRKRKKSKKKAYSVVSTPKKKTTTK